MIKIICEQGSEEWKAARLGIPTASQFSRIITPKTTKLSSQADGYVHELVAEWVIGMALDEISSGWIERGIGMEEDAIQFYELQRDTETEAVGFCLRDDRRVGCSPDRLVGDSGGLEIKCPSAKVHVGYLLGQVDEAHKAQVQGGLWVTGREWWDVMSYCPDFPPALVRVERDDQFIGKLADAIEGFLDRLDDARAQMRALGVVPAGERMAASIAVASAHEAEIERRIFGDEGVPF